MKICLINNLYRPFNRGGAERIVETVATGLEQTGHEVIVIATKPIGARCREKNVYYLNSFYYHLNKIPKPLRLLWHLGDLFDFVSYLKIKSILNKEKPAVVITNNLKGLGYLIPRLLKRLKIKHLHTLHDIQLLHPAGLMLYGREKQINGLAARIYAGCCRRLFASPAAVISPSAWLMKIHTDKNFFPRSQKIILPNPAPAITAVNKNKPTKIFRFLYVGQVEKHKGILFLIEVFKRSCFDQEKNLCRLTIVGTGTKIKKAKKLAANEKNIEILGRRDNSEIIAIMSATQALILPSLCYENSPTVIYEAAAVGLPIIASRLGGTTELVRALGGILFTAGNEGDLMYQMKWLLEHPQMRQTISQQERKNIQKFSSQNYIKKLMELVS